MALARTYYSVNGEIIGEHRQGEANSRDYTRDSLGSVIAVYQNDWEIAEAIYKPYGEMIGGWNFSDYRFGWNGAHGYRRTNMAWTTHYVRARHYSQIGANWTTRDPLWPQEMPYNYVSGMTMSAVDYLGLASCAVTSIEPTNDPCSPQRPLTAFQACVASMCTMASLKAFAGIFKTLAKGIPEEPQDLKNWLDILDQKDPITDTKDCCKVANSFKGGIKDIDPTSDSKLIAQILAVICRSLKTKGNGICAASTTNESDCIDCCSKKFTAPYQLGQCTGICSTVDSYRIIGLSDPRERL